MKLKDISKNGFTLIELILYIALVTIVLTALVPFGLNIVGSRTKSSVVQEVGNNARSISERIKYEIRNASGINSVSSTSLSLATSNSSTNPTVIDLSGGNIRVKQGIGSPINLNSSNTVISNLKFTNFTSGDNKTKNIQFSFTIDASYSSAGKIYQHTINVESDAEVRSN